MRKGFDPDGGRFQYLPPTTNPFPTYTSAQNFSSQLKALQTYALFRKSSQSLDGYLFATLISHFSKLNTIILVFARSRPPKLVFKLIGTLSHLGLKPDVFTLSPLVKACESLEKNDEAAHGVCVRMGFGLSTYWVSGSIENYARVGDIEKAKKCFEECLAMKLEEWRPNCSSRVVHDGEIGWILVVHGYQTLFAADLELSLCSFISLGCQRSANFTTSYLHTVRYCLH